MTEQEEAGGGLGLIDKDQGNFPSHSSGRSVSLFSFLFPKELDCRV